LNIEVIENFIIFLMRGRTQNFDFERRTYDQFKLIDLRDTIFNSK
jgi:hypothetical protein